MDLRRLLNRVGEMVYRKVPSRRLRAAAFAAFARAVRNRHVTASVHGANFALDLGEVIDLALYLGQFEPEVSRAARRYLRPGMTVFDIGANMGAHTLLFAQLVGPNGRVLAFEPTDYAFRKLQRNLALNDFPRVTALKLALSDREESAVDVHFRSSWPTSGPRRDGVSVVDFGTLDGWCTAHGIESVDLVKLDVDGNEFALLRGGIRIIERCRPTFLMEAVGPHFDDDARNPYRLLSELGYRFEELKTGRAITEGEMRQRLPRNDVGMTVSMNVIGIAGNR